MDDISTATTKTTENETNDDILPHPNSEHDLIQDLDSSDDSSEVEDEPTEEDLKFIVQDDLSDTSQPIPHRKRKKKHSLQVQEEDLEDDDLDLINENIGTSKKVFKRLRKKAYEKTKNINQLFDEDEQQPPQEQAFDENELYEEDDLEDFIIDDEEGDMAQRQEQLRRKKNRLEFVSNRGADYGVSDEAWAEINELFGDGRDYDFALMSDTEEINDQNDAGYDAEDAFSSKKSREIKLKDVYEPAVIAKRMLTENDENIRKTDIPERYQMDRKTFNSPDENQILRESMFISRQLIKESQQDIMITVDHPLVKAVFKIVKFIRVDQLEIPFIATHRKDYFVPHLGLTDLWRVYDLDEKFLTIESKKRTLKMSFNEISRMSSDARNNDYAIDLIEKAATLDEISDMQLYLQVTYCMELSAMESTKARHFKKPVWRVAYEGAKRNSLDKFAKMFGIDTKKYASSLVLRQTTHFPEDVQSYPLESAQEFVCPLYPTPEKVLQATREMIAQEIAVDPVLRGFLRRVYSTDAVVTITPTHQGKMEIKEGHKYYPFKYMTNKAVPDFKDGQFLSILAAEQEGLVTINARVEMEDALIADMVNNIKNDYYNIFAESWNAERVQIAEFVSKGILFEQTVKWLKEMLRQNAIDYVSNMCKITLEKKLDVAPFRPAQDDEEFVDDTPPTVLALSWGEGGRSSATHCVVVDPEGFLKNEFVLPKLGGIDRLDDMDQLDSKIGIFEPDIIVLAGFHPGIKTNLLKIVEEIIQKGKEKRKWKKDIVAHIVDDDVSRIFMKSNRGTSEYPEATRQLSRYLVSLARKVQDPVTEYAGLMNSDDDFKHLHLHPLQKLVPDEKLKKALERSFMNVVASCGVDINRCVSNPQLSGALQFVSGLGPRKAQAIISKIIRNDGKLQYRSELITNEMCGPNTFINCSSFIRIKERHFAKVRLTFNIDPLDDTRIHPEDYDIARKMAADALDIDDAMLDEENPSQHVTEIMENESDRLLMLMLDDYADELERSDSKLKKIALNEMRDELMAPYLEKRRKFESASIEEIFTMLTSETNETLHYGSLVNCLITRVKERFIFCQHDSGIEGIVHVKNVDVPSDMERDPQLQTIFAPGTTIAARVLEVNKERLSLELDIRKQSVLSKEFSSVLRDPTFSREREANDLDSVVISKKKDGAQGRTIQHPFFKNLDFKSAEEYLSRRPRGEIVVRPSTKGNDHISITWKVDEGIYQHIDVLEKDKENQWSLGKILKIDSREFLEIDQIIAEHVEPMTRRITDIIQHVKFQRKNRDEMYKYIEEQANFFKKSMYGFILSNEKPGCFYLVYKHPSNRVHNDVLIVQPEGFIYRSHKFRDIESLLRYFKQDESKKLTMHKGNASGGGYNNSRRH